MTPLENRVKYRFAPKHSYDLEIFRADDRNDHSRN